MIEALVIFAIIAASVVMIAHFAYTLGKDTGYTNCHKHFCLEMFPHSVDINRRIPGGQEHYYTDICAMFHDKKDAEAFRIMRQLSDEHNHYEYRYSPC